jgi:hypothetical protein
MDGSINAAGSSFLLRPRKTSLYPAAIAPARMTARPEQPASVGSSHADLKQ